MFSEYCTIFWSFWGNSNQRKKWRRSGVFIVNLEHILHLFLVFLFTDFEQANVSWGIG